MDSSTALLDHPDPEDDDHQSDPEALGSPAVGRRGTWSFGERGAKKNKRNQHQDGLGEWFKLKWWRNKWRDGGGDNGDGERDGDGDRVGSDGEGERT